MPSNTESLPIAAKNSPRSHHKFVTFLYNLADCLTGNANFGSPTPSAAALKSAGDALAAANAKAKNGGPIAVAARNSLRKDDEALVDQLVTYVNTTVKANAGDPATATSMIVSSGLSPRKRGKIDKAPLAAKHGSVTGVVVLIALAVGKPATYFWEVSSNGTTWTSAGTTMKAETTITGLTPGQMYSFRFRAQTRKGGMGNYSQVVSLMVI